MSEYKYKQTTWIGGKTIGTADVMNNIEDGIAKAHERLEDVNSQLEQKAIELATVEDLKQYNANLGDRITTFGYYFTNDGGGALDIAQRETLQNINIYSELNQYGPNSVDTSKNVADGQYVVIK